MDHHAIIEAAQRGDYRAVIKLARKGHGWSQADLGRRMGYDQTAISRFESGARALSDVGLLHRFAEALDLSPWMVGVATAPDRYRSEAVAQGSDDVNRQAFLRALAAAVAGVAVGSPAMEAIGRAASGDIPSRVGISDIEQVNDVIRHFGEWQDLYGGGACIAELAQQVRWAIHLLNAAATDRVSIELYRSVGFLIDVAGWGAFDAGHHTTARRYFEESLGCAEKAKDWGLRANVLSDMARQAIYLGRPDDLDDSLSLIELAQVRQDRQTPTVRAMLATVHARTLAKVGRSEDCYAAVQDAEDHFADRDPVNDPPWISYFDEADMAGDAGHALFDIALTGQHIDTARRYLRRSIDSYSPLQARARAFSLCKLAILELSVGEAGQGITYAEQALAAEGPLTSRRARDDLVAVRKALSSREEPDATDLRVRITEALTP